MKTITEKPKDSQILNLSDITESLTNPRKHFDETDLSELAKSIEEQGVIQPIIVRELSFEAELAKNGASKPKPFEIVAGARRYRASLLAKKTTIPAIVVSMTDEAALEIQVIENLQRKDLSAMEEALSYEALIVGKFKYTPERIALRIGKSLKYVKERLQLTKLIKPAQEALYENKILLGHAQLIARIEDEKNQEKALKLCFPKYGPLPTLNDLRDKIQSELFVNLKSAKFKLDDADLLPIAGSCDSCPHNSGNKSELFEDIKEGGMCTKPSCFQQKTSAYRQGVIAKEVAKGAVELTTKEANAIFTTWNSSRIKSEADFVNSTDPCPAHPKKLTYKQLAKDLVPEYVGFDSDGKLRRVMNKSAFAKAIENEPWAKKAKAGAVSKGTAETIVSKEDQERDRRREIILGDLLRKNIVTEVMKRKLDAGFFHAVVLDTIFSNGGSLEEEDFEAIGLKIPPDTRHLNGDEKFIKKYYDKLKAEDRFKVDLLLLVLAQYDGIDQFTKQLKLKTAPLKAQAKKLEAAEWAEKSKQPADAKVAEPKEEDDELPM